ncbi:MAG TPA: L,D-transpeptidase family protein [Candidatus Tripitaka californicus]|uniref:L,D-transpeptidase family protein n=1 Tax=Candidatus Tripitaka californicus TaxID=3367616 RepID=UPI004028F719|nr:L,D-transpeptidase family protein [Planctomycetota bacterium]
MITLFFLLCSILFLSPLAQAKDKDEVVQKADILFKTEAKESPKAKKPTAQTPGGVSTHKTTPPQTVTPSQQAKEVTKKAKTSETTSAKTTPKDTAKDATKATTKDTAKGTNPGPGPAPSAGGSSHDKGEAVDTKTSTSAPSQGGTAQSPPAGVPLPPLASRPEVTTPSDTRQADVSTSPSEPRVAGPLQSPSLPQANPVQTPGVATTPAVAGPIQTREVAFLPGAAVLPASTTASQSALQETLQQAYECLQKDKKYEARNLYSQALFMETSEERRQLIRRHLEELNNVLVFSATTSPDLLTYNVQKGDNLAKIAKQYDTTAELLMRLNRKSSPLLRVGEPLRVLKGKTGLLVDKSDFTLTLLLDGHYLKQYPVGLGKNDKTPEGRFVVEIKMKEPTWFSPLDGKVYAYGSPQNLLGTRWMGFQNQPGLSGYGIHGTTEPDSVGTESSNGCIRMLSQDVEELYDYVTPGTEVIIQR